MVNESLLAEDDPAVSPDAALMERLRQDDGEAWEALYMRYRRMVLSILAGRLPRAGGPDLEDLCQEVFITLYQTADRYREEGRFRSWLCGIAVRKAQNFGRRTWFRRKRLERSGSSTTAIAGAQESAPGARVEARLEVERAISSLPAAQREVLLLHTVAELSGEEIAAVLGLRPGAVRTRLHRARRALESARAKGPRTGGGS